MSSSGDGMIRDGIALLVASAMAAAVLGPSTGAASEAMLRGAPPITRIQPDLEVFPQNFDVVQATDGLVYMANYDGVMIFDGERWELVATSNGDIVRSLAAGDEGRVYVGGYDAFGYIEHGPDGEARYRELSGRFADQFDGEAFADIWEVLVTEEQVFFQAVQHLFAWDPATGETRMWHHPERFGTIVETAAGVMVQFRGHGLRLLRDGVWEPAPGGDAFPDLAFDLVPLAGGGHVVLAADGRWRAYDGTGERDFPVPDGFPPSNRFTSGVMAADGRLVLAGDDGSLRVLDPATGASQRIPLATGYLSGLALSAHGGLLVAADDALYQVEWPSPWGILGAEDGLTASVHALRVLDGEFLALTGSDVQALRASGSGDRFERLGWTDHEAWDLLALDDGSALLAESYQVLEVSDAGIRPLTGDSVYPRVLMPSPRDPGIVYAGTEVGLAVLRREAGEWRTVLEESDMDNLRVTSMLETGPRELLLGSERGGVRRVRFAEGFDRILAMETFGPEQGLDYGETHGGDVTRLPDGEVLITTVAGQFLFEDEGFVPTSLGGLDAIREPGQALNVEAAPDGTLWAYSYNRVYRRPPGAGWLEEDLSRLRAGALMQLSFAGGLTVLSTSSAILSFRDEPAATGSAPAVVLRAVEHLPEDGDPRALDLVTERIPEFAYGDFGIRFRFALPELRRPEAVRYRARLEGYEDWSENWSESTTITYSRLRPGDYAFQVIARDSHGRSSRVEPYRFRVLPRWYATPWARSLWVVLTLVVLSLLTWVIVRSRTRRLEGETRRLESMVLARTAELETANRQLETMAHVDGLTGIPNRRRLDEYLEHVWVQAAERRRPVSLLAIDVDHFKAFNDRYGHLAGDELLKKLARALSACLRRTEDLVARYGGEEFLVVLPGADANVAAEMAARMREQVEESSLGSTISVGIASATPDGARRIVGLVEEADAALYRAKSAGRNCVRSASA